MPTSVYLIHVQMCSPSLHPCIRPLRTDGRRAWIHVLLGKKGSTLIKLQKDIYLDTHMSLFLVGKNDSALRLQQSECRVIFANKDKSVCLNALPLPYAEACSAFCTVGMRQSEG